MYRSMLRYLIFLAGCIALSGFPYGQTPAAPPLSTRVSQERYYTLTARVRPLLFWISRSGVGGGKIAWEEEVGGVKQIQLLIGSDPERAPRKINRWGYIRESVSGSSLELLGVMTESEEESIDQAQARIEEAGARHAFKAIRGKVRDGRADATVVHLLTAENYTYRDLDRFLLKVPVSGSITPTARLKKGVEPGFLLALKNLIHGNVERFRSSGKAGESNEPRLFVYNGALYELTECSLKPQASIVVNGRPYQSVIESRFQTRKIANGSTSDFTIVYGTADPIREVPIRIVYRPRWWFEAELQLTDNPAVALALQEGPSWNPGHK